MGRLCVHLLFCCFHDCVFTRRSREWAKIDSCKIKQSERNLLRQIPSTLPGSSMWLSLDVAIGVLDIMFGLYTFLLDFLFTWASLCEVIRHQTKTFRPVSAHRRKCSMVRQSPAQPTMVTVWQERPMKAWNSHSLFRRMASLRVCQSSSQCYVASPLLS